MLERRAPAWLSIVLIGAWPASIRSDPGTESFHVDPAKSHATIDVGKGGLLSFAAGHTHTVTAPVESGIVDLNRQDLARSQVRLVIGAKGATVSAKGEPPDDVPKVQAAMVSDKVLDVARHPTITFQSTSVAVRGDASRRTDGPRAVPDALDLMVAGQLTIRSATRPITVPVHVDLTGDALTATGRFSIKQTAYGIKPISVAGVVTVKDTLDIHFTIVARR